MQWRQNFLSRCEIGVRALKQKKLLIIINKKGEKKRGGKGSKKFISLTPMENNN